MMDMHVNKQYENISYRRGIKYKFCISPTYNTMSGLCKSGYQNVNVKMTLSKATDDRCFRHHGSEPHELHTNAPDVLLFVSDS